MKHKIDLVLPLYNPIDGWAENIVQRFMKLSEMGKDLFSLSLIIVNDGSSTKDLQIGKQLIEDKIAPFRWISYEQNRGKGFALRKGIDQTTAPFIVFTDIDFPYEQESMIALFKDLTSGQFDAVIGIRDESYYGNLPSSRKRISHILKKLNARILGLKIADTQGGLKGFSSKLKPIFLSTSIDRYLFDLEFVYLISKDDSIQLKPLVVTLRDGVTFSKLKLKILIIEGLNFLKVFFKRKG